jgi:hypothetical protein
MDDGRRKRTTGAAMMCLFAWLATGCETGTGPELSQVPPGPDVTTPFPIDRGDEGPQTPGTYKGLPLRLTDNGRPVVTPVDGVIGLVCVGMSNAMQECDVFKSLLESEWISEVNPAVRVVNCARGGHAIEKWIDPAFDEDLWERCIQVALPAEGVRPDQVRVIFHKAADQFTKVGSGEVRPPYPDPDGDFPLFQSHLTSFAERVPTWFPNVVAVYTSSRSYGGFANDPGRGEPLSYEEGHALNEWLADHARVLGVWYGWGAYLWAPACADGGFNGSGICYDREDYVEDGVHPSSPEGREKIAGLIHDRFLDEAWYAR